MQIVSALIWEAQGEPRREEVILSDENGSGTAGGLVVLNPEGRPRATRPDDLPAGSVLLVPPQVSDEELATIERSGYRVCRSALVTRDAAVAEAEIELEEVTTRLASELRRRHPELFDAAGRLRPSEYSRAALELSGGKRTLTRQEVLRLGQQRVESEAETQPPDGP